MTLLIVTLVSSLESGEPIALQIIMFVVIHRTLSYDLSNSPNLNSLESGERMAVGVTILLAMAVFFLMLEATMPSSSEVPLLAKYYCVTVVEVCCCLLSMCWILRFIHHDSEPLPNWVKVIEHAQ